jgi:hypothetical protein
VKSDFSNLERACEHVMAAHTYRHRVEVLLGVIGQSARHRPVAANDCHDAGLQV